MFNVVLVGEVDHIFEVQVAHSDLLHARKGLPGHQVYNKVRNAAELCSVWKRYSELGEPPTPLVDRSGSDGYQSSIPEPLSFECNANIVRRIKSEVLPRSPQTQAAVGRIGSVPAAVRWTAVIDGMRLCPTAPDFLVQAHKVLHWMVSEPLAVPQHS